MRRQHQHPPLYKAIKEISVNMSKLQQGEGQHLIGETTAGQQGMPGMR
jgi:hypothetical protein